MKKDINKVWVITWITLLDDEINVANDICESEEAARAKMQSNKDDVIADMGEDAVIRDDEAVFRAANNTGTHTEYIKLEMTCVD